MEPRQLIEVKALQGDTSDNIPGVPGIGPKTAISLIKKYNSVKELYEKIEKGEDDLKGRFIMFPIETISARMLDYYVGRSDALIIDLRDEAAYAESHVRGAISIPYEELENRNDLPLNKILVFYCDRGGASMAAAREFVRRGYRTRSVIGGFAAYRGRNLVIF